jgi:hypothetical protein
VGDEPEFIFIHPQSFFSLDVTNHHLSTTLVPPLPNRNAKIWFPTRSAFLDYLTDTVLDPPIGYRHWKLTMRLETFISYLIYTLRAEPRILPSGELEPERASMLSDLRPENRAYIEDFMRGTRRGWAVDVQNRRTFMRTAG